ncbi:MAG: tRNA uridine-5-carboxymethylaminomethyl(34) synthesis enzyme MnmG [Eubacteriaceae bacterium]|mgnify:CR=1 FL=1|jgi:tRNA uridine 5-carboxymethylaminomethyl modification enzyme|nr:tRNA uridine-5-carboxymethylaminomethyl(34) synthesis enzyme MnmG [Eubacteriaceae bacterium]
MGTRKTEPYDIVIIGAGHAGCEAALAAARKGKNTLLLTMNLDSVALLPCNPSIGGTGKGHLVREIDALGGEMGKNIDKAFIQSRMLNTAKGHAVRSLRAQADKKRYQSEMKQVLENQQNLTLMQQEAEKLLVEEGIVRGVITKTGRIFSAAAVIVASGTYLNGKIIIGETSYTSGPNGMSASEKLSENLLSHGLRLMRLKTGTPARINKRSVDFSKMQRQDGDEVIEPFSFENDFDSAPQVPCYLTYTNEETKRIILENLHRAPMYSGMIEGVGVRYCPSIEDKIVRFADKEKHQLFIEPEGLDTNELYVQGMSSSLPEDVQEAMMHTVPGLEKAEIMRSAYAIEYDAIEAHQLTLSLETKQIKGLFMAGQINGSSGYEEAAAQGLIAGINAVNFMDGKAPLILDRSQAYIGVLIDDLVTKGTAEPYRMMTSRVEYRLLLRQDNADLRLTEIGYEQGLISEERYQKFLQKKQEIQQELQRLKSTKISKETANAFLQTVFSSPVSESISLYELLKRPEITYNNSSVIDPSRKPLEKKITQQVEISIQYEGYIRKQQEQVARFLKMEEKKIDEDIDYQQMKNLRLEAREKLNKIRPTSLGQASRITGVSPADISALMIYMEKMKQQKLQGEKNK